MIKTPTKIIIAFVGNFLVRNAPIGAAMTPPINNPAMIFQFVNGIIKMKIADATSVTKNSEKFTEPMVFLGE